MALQEKHKTPVQLDCGGKGLVLHRPHIMGILNLTPDSFSDGGVFIGPDAAVGRAMAMVEQGADIIDVGGESTRPGAVPVSVDEELDRVMPVLEALCRELPVPVSIDTSKAAVMTAAAAAGAGLINDVLALRGDGALEAARDSGLPVCLMHMQGSPRTMQQNPVYHDVIGEVKAFLGERVAACAGAGIPRHRLLLDPGFGFGKTRVNNYQLLNQLDSIVSMGLPVLVGMSRKGMLSKVADQPANLRVNASIAAAVLAAARGALVIRVHDVAATAEALVVVNAMLDARVAAAGAGPKQGGKTPKDTTSRNG